MKILYLLTMLAMPLVGRTSLSQTVTLADTISFELVHNRIVLRIPDNQGDSLNIIFDSASNAFHLDSAVSLRLGIITDSIVGRSNFMNGSVKSLFFSNQNIFRSALLNKLYKRGESIDMEWISTLTGIRIDGIIGLNDYMKIVAEVDFENNRLYISEVPVDLSQQEYVKIKMSYTDAGFDGQAPYSRMLRRIPACKIYIRVSNTLTVETNMQFDTGYNQNFALLATLNVDSIAQVIGKPFTSKNRKTSFGAYEDILYYMKADSIVVETLGEIVPTDIVLSKASHMAIAGFGTSKWMCLAGIDFLKAYPRVYFDLINRFIYLKKT